MEPFYDHAHAGDVICLLHRKSFRLYNLKKCSGPVILQQLQSTNVSYIVFMGCVYPDDSRPFVFDVGD